MAHLHLKEKIWKQLCRKLELKKYILKNKNDQISH